MSRSKYSEAIRLLDSQFAFFVTHVLNIGKPVDTNIVATACVMTDVETAKSGKAGDDFYFAFNPDFADQLDVEDYAFVLAHETMHIILDHLNLAPRFSDKVRFNIAADCVINDYLISAGFDASQNIMDQLMSGQKNVGYNCAHVTVGQVYDDIPQDIVDQMGEGMKIDSHDWIHIPDSLAKKILEEIAGNAILPSELQDIKDDINAKSNVTIHGGGAGTGSMDAKKFIEVNGVSMNWVNLLKELDPDIFNMKGGKKPRPSYHRRPRKLGGFPEVILPVKEVSKQNKFGEKPVIFMALDTSGSIGDDTARKFITLARSIPRDNIHLEVITFTDSVMPLDLDNPRFQSGGTSFSPIESYIRSTVMPKYKNKYPSSVVVITDGDASFYGAKPEDKHKDNWFWLLDGYYLRSSHLFGKIKTLKEYIK